MKYALIGCGRIAPNHLTAAKANALEIKAVCDLDRAKAEALLSEYGLEETKVYTDYLTMLEQEELDLVAVATYSGEHAKIALACIRKGIHVIIEKPIALSLEDADKLIEEGKRYQVKVCVNHQNRFNPTIQTIRKAVEENRLGKLLYGSAVIRWYRGEDYFNQADWRGTWEQDGGALMNQCIHNIDLLRWMMGDEIEEVVAYTANQAHPYIEAEDLGLALVKFKNGTFGTIEGCTSIYPNGLEETLSFFGEKGTVRAGGMSVNHMEVWNVQGEMDKLQWIQDTCNENPENVYGFGHNPLYRDMIHAIEADEEPLVDAYAGKRALELVLAIYEASAKGGAVRFPLEHGATMDYFKATEE